MKKLAHICTFACVILLLAISACRNSPVGSEAEVKPAPIHELTVTFSQSYPVHVTLYVKGGLADGCTSFDRVEVKGRSDHVIAVSVTTKRPRAAVCTQVYGFFEQNVDLGSDFDSGRMYTAKVNDKAIDFTMP